MKGNEKITKGLLNSILEEKITKVTLDCDKILERDLFDDKLGILDIRAKINENIDCDIEMQIANHKNIEKRIIYYLSKMYASNLNKSQNYRELHKCIAIVFIDFELEKLKGIEQYITKWNMREAKNSHIILTDAIEIYIIEMPKVKKYEESSNLDIWLKLITNMEEVYMNEEYNAIEGIKEAKKVVEEISSDEYERYLAHLREKHILDTNSLVSEGYDKGIEKGIKQGQEEAMKEAAKKLKKEKVNIEIISKCTGLSIEEIKKL